MGKAMRVFIIILSVLLALEAYNIVCKFRCNMAYRYCEYHHISAKEVECPYVKSELKAKVDGLFNLHYMYFGVMSDSRTFIPLRIVKVNENIYPREYAKHLAHELSHLKYQTQNERFATYQAIVTLYESGDEFLKYVAIDYANEVWCGKFHDTEHDCGAYLVDYFNNVT